MSVVSKRYADAYLSSAEDASSLDEVGKDISGLLELIEQSDDFSEFLRNPLIDPDLQKSCLEKLFKGRLDSVTTDFLLLLVEKERLADLEGILEASLHSWREKKGILPVSVTSAQDMSADQKKALEKKLADRTGKTIESTYHTDPDLLGGFRLLFQGVVEDYSLAAKLHTFKRNVLNA